MSGDSPEGIGTTLSRPPASGRPRVGGWVAAVPGAIFRFFAVLRTPSANLPPPRPNDSPTWPRRDVLLLLLGLLAYAIVWSTISILKFYAFNAQVYDLGITYTEFWQITHNSWSALYFAYVGLLEGIRLPLFWLPWTGYPFGLVFQTLLIGASVFPIYGIARYSNIAHTTSLVLALSYLVYFGIIGVNWYDFHVEAFFPILFLTGYFFFLRRNYWIAAPLFLLSGLTRYPFMGYALLFAFVLVVEELILLIRSRPGLDPAAMRFAVALGSIAVAYFIAFQLIAPAATVGPTFQTHYFGGSVLNSLDLKLVTVLLVVGPVAPLLPYARRWPIFLLPFLVYMFVANYYVFYYPVLLTAQYGVMFAPFVYLVGIEGLGRLRLRLPVDPYPKPAPTTHGRTVRRWRLPGTPERRGLVVMAGSIAVLALAFEPFSPFNGYTPVNFDLAQQIGVNWTFYNEFTRLASYVPADDPYVVIQEDMPMLLPRALPYGTAMVPTIANFTLDPQGTGFEILDTSTGTWTEARIDYLVANPYHLQYYYYANSSMFDMISTLYGEGAAGFVAEASGLMLLETGYTGPLLYFVPFTSHLAAQSFGPGNVGQRLPNGNLIATNPGSEVSNVAWTGSVSFLTPGEYNFTFLFETSTLVPSNLLHIDNPVTTPWNVTSRNFSAVNTWTAVTERGYLSSPVVLSQIIAGLQRWDGDLTFGGLTINEVGPPKVV